MTPKQKKIILIAIAALLGLLVLVSLAVILYQSQKGKVITTILPHDATVKLDGKEISGNGTHFVEPGRHEFVITRAAFVEKKIEFDIAKGETKAFDLFIVPDEDAGIEWAEQNPDETSAIDGKISEAYETETERVYANNQILNELPIIDTTFRIDYGVSKTGRDFALYIQATDQEGRTNALMTLEVMGHDPSKFEIIYVQP